MAVDGALIISAVSLLISLVAILIADRQARESNKLAQQISKGETISHFTDRFLSMLRDVTYPDLAQQILNDPAWASQFWSLHATEFYFFHHGILPRFMYSLWMVYLGELYSCSEGDQIWAAHKAYLDTYSLDYDEMYKFYTSIYNLAREEDSQSKQNRKIAAWIEEWFRKNKRTSFN